MLTRISQRRGMTMVELLLSLSISTALMAGIASSMVLASRAIPNPDSTLVSTLEAYRAAEEMAGNLCTAKTVTERTVTSVAFTVADRDNDTNDETIRYAWSGTPGDPLTRQYNGGTAISIADNVHTLSFRYSVRTRTETVTQEVANESAETLLAFFDGWSGITPTTDSRLIAPSFLESEYFEVTPLAGTTKLRITRALLLLYYDVIKPVGIQVAIRRSTNDGSYEPMAAPIGTPVTIPGAALSIFPTWQTATFSDVIITDPNRTDYCLVSTVIGGASANVDGYYSMSAPDNGMYQKTSYDGGSTWAPGAMEINRQDLRFYVYGVYTTTSMQDVTTSRYFVDGVNIKVRVGSDATATAYTSVPILNGPEVATP